MTDYTETVKSLIADMRTAISLSTRIPVGPTAPVAEGDIARASWALPVAGILVGLTGAIVYWLAIRLHLQPEPAAMLALGATILVTGAMHEDGLADAADGFGGGKTAEQKLEIMRDSRIGAFGACALIVSIVLRWSSLAAIADPRNRAYRRTRGGARAAAAAHARAPTGTHGRVVGRSGAAATAKRGYRARARDCLSPVRLRGERDHDRARGARRGCTGARARCQKADWWPDRRRAGRTGAGLRSRRPCDCLISALSA
jgi:hypothetical protein